MFGALGSICGNVFERLLWFLFEPSVRDSDKTVLPSALVARCMLDWNVCYSAQQLQMFNRARKIHRTCEEYGSGDQYTR